MISVYSGSWNPLHWGHLSIANYVEQNYLGDVIFELCRQPFDKPELTDEDIAKRKKQFTMLSRQLLVTSNTSFLEKSTVSARKAYRSIARGEDYHVQFIIGYDTARRIDDPKYYFGSIEERDRALELFHGRRCKFLVFPRDGLLTDGLSVGMMELCDFADDFTECAVSSSEIRTPQRKEISSVS